jgi:uncharacterized protein DUF2800
VDFNAHSDLVGLHAFLSASNYHWINYDLEKLDYRWRSGQAAARGTALHDFAHRAIILGQKLPRSSKSLNQYVNDAIGFRMNTEQVLFYSENCFGTADAISFRKNFLRIHDLKTGEIKGSVHQLEVYAAMFCLEYGVKPESIDIELRIYQADEIEIYVPEPAVIVHVMQKIVAFDRRIELLKAEL